MQRFFHLRQRQENSPVVICLSVHPRRHGFTMWTSSTSMVLALSQKLGESMNDTHAETRRVLMQIWENCRSALETRDRISAHPPCTCYVRVPSRSSPFVLQRSRDVHVMSVSFLEAPRVD